jgi:hypothetical protein
MLKMELAARMNVPNAYAMRRKSIVAILFDGGRMLTPGLHTKRIHDRRRKNLFRGTRGDLPA